MATLRGSAAGATMARSRMSRQYEGTRVAVLDQDLVIDILCVEFELVVGKHAGIPWYKNGTMTRGPELAAS